MGFLRRMDLEEGVEVVVPLKVRLPLLDDNRVLMESLPLQPQLRHNFDLMPWQQPMQQERNCAFQVVLRLPLSNKGYARLGNYPSLPTIPSLLKWFASTLFVCSDTRF